MMTLAHYNCPECGRLQLNEWPRYPQDGSIAERLRAMSEMYDPKHLEGGYNWCTDVGAARLMREAAACAGKVADALRLVLPMARAHATRFPVGANLEYIAQAEAALAAQESESRS